MRQRYVLFLIFFLSFSFLANAQNGKKSRFDIEAMKKEKAEFLTQEMKLSPEEIKSFLPLEAEFMQKKFEVNRDVRRETRELKKKENKTDADYKRITELNLHLEQKESELMIEYYKKFGNVLSPQKIELYRNADLKFKEMKLQEHRKRHHGGESGSRHK